MQAYIPSNLLSWKIEIHVFQKYGDSDYFVYVCKSSVEK